MSPFSSLNLPVVGGYGGGIDRDFSPILNYLDEFDRHFSRRHRFMNCFIPRFDLEEDAHNYYLYGDIPGATIDNITIDAESNHTLVIYGKTLRTSPFLPLPTQQPQAQQSRPENDGENGGFVKVQVADGNDHTTSVPVAENKEPVAVPAAALKTESNYVDNENHAPQGDEKVRTSSTSYIPWPPAPPQLPTREQHPHHERHHTFSFSNNPNLSTDDNPNGHRILLSERLVGDFHRTFAFPSPVVEDGVRASLENGVLSLIVPKRDGGQQEKRGRRVPILSGNRFKGEERGSGFGLASGAV